MQARILHLAILGILGFLCVPASAELSAPRPQFRGPASVPQVVSIPKKPKVRKSRQKLIEWAKPKWVDVGPMGGSMMITGDDPNSMNNGSSSGLGKGNGSGSGKGSGAGGGGNGSGGGKNGGSGSQGFNEDAAKNGKQVDPGDRSGDGGDKPKQPPTGDKGDAIAYPLWYPMCLFVDSHVTNDVNESIRGQTEMAAKCGVNLVIFPMTVQSNYSMDPDEINKLQQANCNINEKFKVKASSTSICGQHMESPAKMCDAWKDKPKGILDLDVAGCAQVQAAGGSISAETRQRLQQSGGSTLAEFSGGGSAPSIERPDACTAGVVAHESQGHSQFGQPNGSVDGNGIGTDPPGTQANGGPEGGGSFDGWTGLGCQHMRENSFANDGKWKYNPARKNYFKMEMDPARQWDLKAGRKLFGNPDAPDGGKDTPPPMTAGPDSPPMDPKKSPPGVTPESPQRVGNADISKPDAPQSKHKKKLGVQTPQDIANNVLAQSGTSTPPTIPNIDDKPLNDPKLLPPVLEQSGFKGSQSSASIGYNEGASKNSGAAISPESYSNGSSPSMGSVSGAPTAGSLTPGGGASVGYNEGAAKGEAAGSVISSSEVGARVGRSGSGPVTVGGSANSGRDPASMKEDEQDQKKKRPEDRSRRGKGKRQGGGGLRKGKPTIEIYQSGSGFTDF